jgi:hypothetical protein
MTTNCLNCGQTPGGPFCEFCGQRAGLQPFTLRTLLRQVPKAVFDVDRGLWHTLKGLLLRPGEVINDYLDGRRIRYTNPFTFLLLFAGINAVLYPIGLIDFSKITNPPPDMQQFMVDFGQWTFQYYSLLLLLLLPLASAISRRCFAEYGRNYAEHLILNAYIVAVQAAFGAAVFPFLVLLNQTAWLGVAWNCQIPILYLYSIYAMVKVFDKPSARIKVVLRASMAVVLYFLASVLLFGMAALLYGVITVTAPVESTAADREGKYRSGDTWIITGSAPAGPWLCHPAFRPAQADCRPGP